MKYFWVLFLAFLAIVRGKVEYEVQVDTSRGSVLGVHVNYGNNTSQLYYGEADVFLGIPYVHPPKRFERPANLTKFPGPSPYNATFARPACPQNMKVETSEDCLYLNILSPQANATKKLPVMIWIHGGAYIAGSTWEYPIDGGVRNLVSRGVVVVVIQYRLGLLGFFSTNTMDFPANLGLLDQIEAIKFVKEEISNFGGDTNQITLFGESAGGSSISALSYSPLSQGLFQKGILESTAIFEVLVGYQWVPSDIKKYYNPQFEKFCNYTHDQWNTGNYGPLKECLLKINVSEFVVIDAYQYRIFVDGYFLPDSPDNLWKNRPNISILIGSNKDESMLDFIEGWLNQQVTVANITRQYVVENYFKNLTGIFPAQEQKLALDIIEDIYMTYGVKDDDHEEWLKIWNNFLTGAHIGSIAKDVDYWLWSGNPNVYVYEFTYPSKLGFMEYWYLTGVTDWSPVPHALELYYVWMDWQMPGMWAQAVKNGTATKTDFELLDFFGETWTNFAKNGTPSQNWRPVSSANYEYMQIDAAQQMMTEYRLKDRIFWNKVLPNLINNEGLFNSTDNSKNGNNSGTIKHANFLIFIIPILLSCFSK